MRHPSRHYRLILLDCVNTLLLPEVSRLPRIEVDGRLVPSTAGLLCDVLAPALPRAEPLTLHLAAKAAWLWAEQQRGSEHVEVPADRRFRHFLALVGLEAPDPGLVARAMDTHYQAVIACFTLPPGHRALLERLHAGYRLALLSNFDHAPALRQRLHEVGIDHLLDPILVSDGLGFRKPGPQAFARALAALEEPAGRILFVGDSWEDDVLGGLAAGLDVAWVDHGREAPAGTVQPTYSLPELQALAALLDTVP